MIDEDCTGVEPSYHDPNGQYCQGYEEDCNKPFVDVLRVLHAIHYDVVCVEERYDVQVIPWSREIEHAVMAVNFIILPKRAAIFIEKLQESDEVHPKACED